MVTRYCLFQRWKRKVLRRHYICSTECICIPVSYTHLSIPSSVTSIEISAFSGCTGLSGIEIDSNSIVNIKKNAFYNCSSLNGIELPNSLVEIGEKAFFGCTSLVYIKIPDNVTKIGAFAFQS